MRPCKGNELWKQNLQFVIFYDVKDDFPVAIFDNVREILSYRNMSQTKSNYDLIMVELYRALKRENHYTEMLGRPMTVYLIDTEETEEKKLRKRGKENEKVYSDSV